MAKKVSETKQIRQFSVAMGVLLAILASINFWRHGQDGHAWPYLYGVGGAFAAIGLAFPVVVRPIFRGWMKLAGVLAWLNTRLLLSIVYFLVFTPFGLVTRLFRIDLMDQKFPGPARESYWKKRETRAADPDQYERQF
jgi:hypothetical protein